MKTVIIKLTIGIMVRVIVGLHCYKKAETNSQYAVSVRPSETLYQNSSTLHAIGDITNETVENLFLCVKKYQNYPHKRHI